MGATLAVQATMKWAHVSNDAFRVLTRMALIAHDKPRPDVRERRYFGGHDGLIDVLGRGSQIRKTRLRRVSEAIAELIQVGAIVCEQGGHNGRNAVYELTLDAVPIEAKPKRIRSKTFAKQDAHVSRPKDAHVSRRQDAHRPLPEDAHVPRPPYKEEELLEETQEERFEDPRARSNADSSAAIVLEADPREPISSDVPPGPPTLRVVHGDATDTSRPRQPGLWPAPVDNPVHDLTPGEQARIDVRRLLQDRKRGRASA